MPLPPWIQYVVATYKEANKSSIKSAHGALEWRVISRRVCAVVRRCFVYSGANRNEIMQHLLKVEAKRVPKATNTEPIGCQNEPRDFPKHPLRNMIETVGKKSGTIAGFW